MRRICMIIFVASLAFAAGCIVKPGSQSTAPAARTYDLTASDYTQGQGSTNWHTKINAGFTDIIAKQNQQDQYTESSTWYVGTTGDARPQLQSTGTVAIPAFSWVGDPDTGMYRYGANSIGFSVGAVLAGYWDTNGDLNLNTHNLDNAGAISGTSGTYTGNVEAGGFTIGGVPVGTSTDTYFSLIGAGPNIGYFSGEIQAMERRLYDSGSTYSLYEWIASDGSPWVRMSNHYSQRRLLQSDTYADYGGPVSHISSNLLLYPEKFDNAAWGKSQSTVTADQTEAPDGTTSADLIQENTASSTHQVLQEVALGDSTDCVFSVYAKKKERDVLTLGFTDRAGTYKTGNFDLTVGTTGSKTVTSSWITNVGDGWYRCSILANSSTGGSTPSVRIYLADIDPGTGSYRSYTGDGSSGLYIWGAQLAAGSIVPTPYTPTTTSPAGVYTYRTDLDPDGGEWRLSVKNSSGVVFPRVAIISLSNASATARVVVRDASTNEVWASYDSGSDYWLTMSSYTTANLNSISAAHGQIWIGSKTPAGAEYALFFADFIRGECGYFDGTGLNLHDGGVAAANSATGQTAFGASVRGAILSPTCNDVDIKFVNGRMTVAAAFNGGASIGTASGDDPRVIDTWVDITNTAGIPYAHDVDLTDSGQVFVGFGNSANTAVIYTWHSLPTTDTTQASADYACYSNASHPPMPLPTNCYLNDMTLAPAASIARRGDPAVAVAPNASYSYGVGLWHTNTYDQEQGAGQRWMAAYATPPLFGVPLGCWTLDEAPTGDLTDRGATAAAIALPLTAVGMSAGNQAAVASGADLQAITFSDANDWLQQKIYHDETNANASWSTENWSDGSASATIVDTDTNLEIYEILSGDSPYILVATDGTNVAWGYIRGITTGSPYTFIITNAVGWAAQNWNGSPGSMGAVTKWWILKAAPSAYTDSLTFSLWVRAPSASTGTLAGRHSSDTTSHAAFYFALSAGVPYFGVASGGTGYTTSTSGVPSIADNQWHQLTGVFESSTRVTLYIDGVQVAENTSSIPAAYNETWIPLVFNGLYGIAGHTGGYSWSLAIPSIVKMALSDEQVAGLYRSTQAWFQADSKILIGSNTVYGVTYDASLGRLYAATAAGVYGIDIATGTIVEVLNTSDSDSDGTAISINSMSYAHAAGGVLAWLNAAQLGVWMVQPVKVDSAVYADSNGALRAQAKHGDSVVNEQIVPPGYIQGIAIQHVSDTEIVLRPGRVEVNGVTYMVGSNTTVDAEVRFGSALGNSTYYWMSVIPPPAGRTISASDIYISTTAPTDYRGVKGGWYVGNRRTIGLFKTDSSGDIIPFSINRRWFQFSNPQSILSTASPANPFTLLSCGIPSAVSDHIRVFLNATIYSASTAVVGVDIASGDNTDSSNVVHQVARQTSLGGYGIGDCTRVTDASGNVQYQASTADLEIRLFGFELPAGF